jgi:hypothetical protein
VVTNNLSKYVYADAILIESAMQKVGIKEGTVNSIDIDDTDFVYSFLFYAKPPSISKFKKVLLHFLKTRSRKIQIEIVGKSLLVVRIPQRRYFHYRKYLYTQVKIAVFLHALYDRLMSLKTRIYIFIQGN